MNSKRQTIWLVSMLTLMVILSAYYLFTQDPVDKEMFSENTVQQENKEQLDNIEGLVVDGDNLTEEEILALYEQNMESGGIFSELMDKRELATKHQYDEIMATIENTANDEEGTVAAFVDLEKFEEKTSKKQALETMLMEKFDVAHVDETSNKFNVVVKSENLSKTEAAEIIEEVISVMAVKPSQVSVQYVP
ncbi:SpoIIIAH-like family protein [Paenibacillus yanchengensis]|uniref:SpoIIIAH-like family protein n=1 Tax=Paenibacillus yanchengensis TaxID=2035833 RepID=A0ABW4YK48_9BACL